MLISVRDLHKTYGAVTVLDAVTFVVNAGDRIGIVGANGAGKSTLLRLVTGEETADSGSITLAPDTAIGYLRQAVPATEGQTIDDLIHAAMAHLRTLETRMRALEQALATATGDELATLLGEYGSAAARFQDGGGYELDHRIDAVLAGMRIECLGRQRDVRSLSGGEKARVGLAALLLRAPDVLLLDEPTNHLDGATLEWLGGYLARYAGALLLVSHDRDFLQRTVNRIVAIDDSSHHLTCYAGSYDAYAEAIVAERARWEADYLAQQEEIHALRRRMRETGRQVAHNRPPHDGDKMAYNFFGERVQTTISRNVRAAEERLRRIEADPIARPPKPMVFNPRFAAAALRSRAVIALDRVGKQLGARTILREISATVAPDARIMLTGPNGAGKTTLLTLMAGLAPPDAGAVRLAPNAQLGYLRQEPALPDPTWTVLRAYGDALVGEEAQFIAGLIGHGFFRLEDLAKPVGALSAGQQRKLEIARLIAARPNALLLDEPTNYISLDVLEAFEAAILSFPGPVITVSHDRRFIQRFGGEVWELVAGRLVAHAAGSGVALTAAWEEVS
ncbi:MAG TPA: ABC-F family ATP-binding cassette domain-containing protein [Ktedonobacterales bacterium]|nr:ABC-F family ATP-binding cassette domain-containing protein [Ktedonobacterales bacterium]